jgi:hypothetical protein
MRLSRRDLASFSSLFAIVPLPFATSSSAAEWRTSTPPCGTLVHNPRALQAPFMADDWLERAPTEKAGGYGEALTGTGSAIYCLRTKYSTSSIYFWRYEPGTGDSWSPLSTAGLDNGTFRNGTALAWDHDHQLYAVVGARYSDANRRLFYRYDITSGQWTRLADTPGPQGAGDALAWCPYDLHLYALLGSNSHANTFARYDPISQQWDDSLELPPEKIDDGASLVWTGGSQLYALTGEYLETTPRREFWSYDIPGEFWTRLEDIPDPDGVGDGASLLWLGSWRPDDADHIYALSGNSVREVPGYLFHRYSISSDTWEPLEDLIYPVGDYNGTRIGFADGHIYCWQGAPDGYVGMGKQFMMYEF